MSAEKFFNSLSKAFKKEASRIASDPVKYGKDEWSDIKNRKFAYIADKPVKSAAIFFILPAEILTGALISQTVSASVAAVGAYKIYKNDNPDKLSR